MSRETGRVFSIHATKKLLDRVKGPVMLGPLYGSHLSPDRELDALVAQWAGDRSR